MEIRVLGINRWPARLVVALGMGLGIAIAVQSPPGGIGVLSVDALLGVPLLYSTERAGVHVSAEGIKVVPMLGRSRSYRWSEINGFTVVREPGGRIGGPVVSASLTGRSVHLTPTKRSDFQRKVVQRICDELNADLHRARGKGLGRP